MPTRIPIVAAAVLGVAVGIVGCGGGGTSSAQSQGAAGAATQQGAGPSPAQEINPAGDIPDTTAFVSVSDPSSAVSLKVPEGWARTQSGRTLSYTDHYNSVRIELVAAPRPSVASAQSTEVPAITSAGTHVADAKVSSVDRTAGRAVLVTYAADSPPNSVTGKFARLAVERYEFWRNGTEAVITLSAPTGSDNVDPWRTITDSFRWR